MDDNNYENQFEKPPLDGLQEQRAETWNEAMGGGVPEFAGDDFGVKKAEEGQEEANQYDEGLANAAALINYGLDAAARELGVEQVVQRVKDFDATGLSDPIKDLYEHLGVDTAEERHDVREEEEAAKPAEVAFREETGMPKDMKRSVEGARAAIADMKEVIKEVEGADPRYEEIRIGARAAGMGYFEYAVKHLEKRGLSDLFTVLMEQREKKDKVGSDSDEIEEAVSDEVDNVVEQAGLTGGVAEKVAEEVKEEMAGETDEESVESGFGENNAKSDEETEEDIQKKVEEKIKQMESLNPDILNPGE